MIVGIWQNKMFCSLLLGIKHTLPWDVGWIINLLFVIRGPAGSIKVYFLTWNFGLVSDTNTTLIIIGWHSYYTSHPRTVPKRKLFKRSIIAYLHTALFFGPGLERVIIYWCETTFEIKNKRKHLHCQYGRNFAFDRFCGCFEFDFQSSKVSPHPGFRVFLGCKSLLSSP